MSSKNEFAGRLTEKFDPIPLVPSLSQAYSDNLDLHEKLWEIRRKEEREKLVLLLDHYDIDRSSESAFVKLSLELAREVVPGFQEKQAKSDVKGRNAKWDLSRIIQIHRDVSKLQDQDPRISISQACKLLAKEERWENFLDEYVGQFNEPNPGEALRQAYYQYDRRMKRLDDESKEELIMIEKLRHEFMS